MIHRLGVGVLCLAAYCLPVCSEPYSRSAVIREFHPMSLSRTHCDSCSGITRIYVNSAAWGTSSCRGDAADLMKEDDHILSFLLAGWISGKTVKIEVNDQDQPIDQVCKVTAAWVE